MEKYDKVYAKERYEWYKANHICVQCGQEQAREGHTLCFRCRINRNEARRNAYSALSPEEKQQIRAKHNEIINWVYEERRAAGLCPKCGRKAENGKKTCAYCRTRNNRQRRKKRREQGIIPANEKNRTWSLRQMRKS